MKEHATDDLARLLARLSEIEPEPGVVDRALDQARNALASAAVGSGDPAGPGARRVWRRPRLAAGLAAAVAVVCLAGVVLAFLDFGHARAFAQVQSAIRHVSWVACSVDVLEAAEGMDAKPAKQMLDLSGDRARAESTDGSQIVVIDNRRREMMLLLPPERLAVVQRFSPDSKLPAFGGLFDKLRTGNAKGVERLSDVDFDGRRVHRYRAPQGVLGGEEVLVFVDPQTQLPVRMESVVRDGEGRKLLAVVCRHFSYEPLDPTLFELVPPADYRVERAVDRPAGPRVQPVEIAPLPGPSTPVAIELRLADSAPGDGLTEAVTGDTGQTVFLDPQPVIARGDMQSARVVEGDSVGMAIEVTLTEGASERLAEVTSKNVGKHLAILVDGRLIAAPKIFNRISGKFLMNGFTAEEASKIVRSLRAAQQQGTEQENAEER